MLSSYRQHLLYFENIAGSCVRHGLQCDLAVLCDALIQGFRDLQGGATFNKSQQTTLQGGETLGMQQELKGMLGSAKSLVQCSESDVDTHICVLKPACEVQTRAPQELLRPRPDGPGIEVPAQRRESGQRVLSILPLSESSVPRTQRMVNCHYNVWRSILITEHDTSIQILALERRAVADSVPVDFSGLQS